MGHVGWISSSLWGSCCYCNMYKSIVWGSATGTCIWHTHILHHDSQAPAAHSSTTCTKTNSRCNIHHECPGLAVLFIVENHKMSTKHSLIHTQSSTPLKAEWLAHYSPCSYGSTNCHTPELCGHSLWQVQPSLCHGCSLTLSAGMSVTPDSHCPCAHLPQMPLNPCSVIRDHKGSLIVTPLQYLHMLPYGQYNETKCQNFMLQNYS